MNLVTREEIMVNVKSLVLKFMEWIVRGNHAPRVSHGTAPWGRSERFSERGGGKMRDPGNEVESNCVIVKTETW